MGPPHQPHVPLPAAKVPQQVGLHRLNVAQVLQLKNFLAKKCLKIVFFAQVSQLSQLNSTGCGAGLNLSLEHHGVPLLRSVFKLFKLGHLVN